MFSRSSCFYLIRLDTFSSTIRALAVPSHLISSRMRCSCKPVKSPLSWLCTIDSHVSCSQERRNVDVLAWRAISEGSTWCNAMSSLITHLLFTLTARGAAVHTLLLLEPMCQFSCLFSMKYVCEERRVSVDTAKWDQLFPWNSLWSTEEVATLVLVTVCMAGNSLPTVDDGE